MVCNTICLIYSNIILQNKEAKSMHLDGILALVLQHYQTALWRRYFLLTLLLQHPFSAITSPPLPEKCLALNGT